MKFLVRSLFLALLVHVAIGGTAQTMDSIRYPYGHLYYHSYGKGEPVIILAGGPGVSYLQMEPVAREVAKTNRAILFEQRGTGRSQPSVFDSSTINIHTAHEDLLALLKHLKVDQATFAGHSWGGMLAMSFATAYPQKVRSLILMGPGPFHLDNSVMETYHHNREARLTNEEKVQRDAAFSKWSQPSMSQEEKQRIEYWELATVLYDRNTVDSLALLINRGGGNPSMGGLIFQSLYKEKFDLREKLSQFKKPVHIISGAQDPAGFVSYEIALLVPQAKIHWINKAGHFPMYEAPETFTQAIRESLK